MATQPELLAYHYTEAGCPEQAVAYWRQAGTRALQRSANVEAIAHVQRGLDLLPAFPDAPQRTQHELDFLTTLGPALQATRGYAASEVEVQRPHFLTLLAEASGFLDQPEDGLAALDEALTLMEQTGERYYEAELHRQRGELLLRRATESHPAQDSQEQHAAETYFQHALDVAR